VLREVLRQCLKWVRPHKDDASPSCVAEVGTPEEIFDRAIQTAEDLKTPRTLEMEQQADAHCKELDREYEKAQQAMENSRRIVLNGPNGAAAG
jgi:hypothetical protein